MIVRIIVVVRLLEGGVCVSPVAVVADLQPGESIFPAKAETVSVRLRALPRTSGVVSSLFLLVIRNFCISES